MELFTKDAVFFHQVVDDLLLATVNPAGHGVDQQLQDEGVHFSTVARAPFASNRPPVSPENDARSLGWVSVHYGVR